VVPPTVHPKSKKAYEWRDDSCTLLNTPLLELPVLTELQIEAIRAEFGVKTIRANARRKAAERARVERDAAEVAKTWDGDAEELRRYAVAFTFLDANERDTWLRVCWVLKRHTRGATEERASAERGADGRNAHYRCNYAQRGGVCDTKRKSLDANLVDGLLGAAETALQLPEDWRPA
jgi:hypothetical protein